MNLFDEIRLAFICSGRPVLRKGSGSKIVRKIVFSGGGKNRSPFFQPSSEDSPHRHLHLFFRLRIVRPVLLAHNFNRRPVIRFVVRPRPPDAEEVTSRIGEGSRAIAETELKHGRCRFKTQNRKATTVRRTHSRFPLYCSWFAGSLVLLFKAGYASGGRRWRVCCSYA